MTEAQKFRFYFPAWNACCAANGWRMQKGQLVIAADRLTEEGRKVLAIAKQRALAQTRTPKVDDLRHGAHIVALGRDKSSEHLTNAEVDRVVCLFRLLTDPEDLAAVMKWQSYQRGEDPGADKRIDWFIKQFPDAYVRAISGDKFGSRQWEWLEVAQKQQLARTLSERRRAKRAAGRPAGRSGQQTFRQDAGSTLPKPETQNPKNYVMKPELVFTKGPF